MSCKEAIEMLKRMYKVAGEGTRTKDALKLAITALEIQDGNLYLRDVPGPLSIGVVKGNVFIGDYGEDD